MNELKNIPSEKQDKVRRLYSRYYALRVFFKLLVIFGLVVFAAIEWYLLKLAWKKSQIQTMEVTQMILIFASLGTAIFLPLYKVHKYKIMGFKEWNERREKEKMRISFLGIPLILLSFIVLIISFFLPWGSMFGIEKGLPLLGVVFVSLPWVFPMAGMVLNEEIQYKRLTILGAALLFVLVVLKISSIKFFGRSANFEAGVYMYAVAIIILALGIIRYSLEYSRKLKQSE